jgi:copper(I)-binding protein
MFFDRSTKTPLRRLALFCALITLAISAVAAPGQVSVEDAWVRGTVQGQNATGAFMHLRSDSGATLIGVETADARAVEIHEARMTGNVMTMRPVKRLDLPAGAAVDLRPGGYHLMLIDLKRPLKEGDTVLIKLKLEGKDKTPQELEVKAEVRALTASGHVEH